MGTHERCLPLGQRSPHREISGEVCWDEVHGVAPVVVVMTVPGVLGDDGAVRRRLSHLFPRAPDIVSIIVVSIELPKRQRVPPTPHRVRWCS